MSSRECINWKHFGKALLLVGLLFLFCEVFIYYVVLLQCTWPQIATKMESSIVKVALLSDTHLLGPKFGHWFDKLRREWQMYRAFQTMMTLHNPHVVFMLGDLFDEGYHCSDLEFKNYIKRFHSLFSVPASTKLYVVMGNHDVGFHYRITPTLEGRFERFFNMSSVEMLEIRGNIFVLVNSMALQGDKCFLCDAAERKLNQIAISLNCAKNPEKAANCDNALHITSYSQPIFLQHFPLYRPSDANCNEPDSAPVEIKEEPFTPEWDCLSKESTWKILRWLHPRVAFSGHTHHGCYTLHNGDVPEWTISSFSWRNKNNPSFILGTFAPDNYAIAKCYMPKESTVINIYIVGGIALLLWVYKTRWLFFRGTRIKSK